MAQVFIPASLRKLTNGVRSVTLSAGTVREAINQLEEQFPGIRSRLCSQDRLRPEISVAIDSRICDRGLLEKLPDECEIHFIPSVSGG